MAHDDVESVLEVDNLTVVRNGREILHSISCSLERGSITGLLGPSGCGKTTLMRAIMGVQRITSGSITIAGLPAGDPQLRNRLAFTSQGLSIYRDVSVFENLPGSAVPREKMRS